MIENLSVEFLPALTSPDELAGATVVVIDVLRATTVITRALALGAREVIPCLEVEEARQIAARFPAGQALLGGEREGLKIPGFDLGNSPSEFTPENCAGRTFVFTTTNGTRAMNACHRAARVLLGAFVNLSAVVAALPAEGPVHLLCSGTRGKITREDVLLAGAIVDRLSPAAAVDESALNDQARIALAAWREIAARDDGAGVSPKTLAAELRHSQGGRNLKALRLEQDIDDAAQIDLYGCVGELDVVGWRINKR